LGFLFSDFLLSALAGIADLADVDLDLVYFALVHDLDAGSFTDGTGAPPAFWSASDSLAAMRFGHEIVSFLFNAISRLLKKWTLFNNLLLKLLDLPVSSPDI
jgi:hypothetical protein